MYVHKTDASLSTAQYVQVRPPLHLDAPRWRKPYAGSVVEDGSRRNLQGLDPRSHPLASVRRFNLSDSLGRPLFANIQVRATATRLASVCSSNALPLPPPKISLVCAACLKTDEPEKCAPGRLWVNGARRHRIHPCPSVRAGARTSSPRYGTTRLSERRALHSPTLLLSRLADAALAVVQQDGDCQGHPCRCAYLLPCWSPDSEHVCAQN